MPIDPGPTNQIENVVRSLVAARLEISPARVPMDVPIVSELGLDSMEVMQFLMDIEERFPGFCFADSSVSDLRTLNQLVEAIKPFAVNA